MPDDSFINDQAARYDVRQARNANPWVSAGTPVGCIVVLVVVGLPLLVIGLIVASIGLGVAQGLGIVDPPDDPRTTRTSWSGEHRCADGPRSMSLTVFWPDDVERVHPDLPEVPDGEALEIEATVGYDDNPNETRSGGSVRSAVSMAGTFDGTVVTLIAKRPDPDRDAHEFTGLTGILDDPDGALLGSTNAASCPGFELQLDR